jgi:serine/threonine protein phosphatase PrpC
MEKLLDFLLAKDTREGIGCDNMTAIIVTLK